jgi:hypothetical protein
VSDGISRRSLLEAAGTAGTVGLAGCTNMLEGDEDTENNGNSGRSTDKPTPEYSQISDHKNSIDATQTDNYSFTAGIERQLGDETTLLNAEIQNAYIIRDNKDYSNELLEDSGLYNEVLDELEEGEDGEYILPTEQLLPGNNQLHLELSVNDEEHNHSETYTFEETFSVETTPEQALQQTWIEDRELFTKLRTQHRENVLSETAEFSDDGGYVKEGDTWMDIANMIYDWAEEEANTDIRELDFEERIGDTAFIWSTLAMDAVDGAPSGQANYLAFTLEELEDVESTLLPNHGHHTVPFYKRDEDKMYHLDSTSGALNFPPKEGRWFIDNSKDSPLFNLEDDEMMELAKATLTTIGQLMEYREMRESLSIEDETAETAMERLKVGTDQETMVNTMQYMGLSSVLSPGMNFKISGDIDDPEISVRF